MKTRDDLIADSLKLLSEQYGSMATRFAAIDTKAQGAATLSGILLSACLAFVPQASFEAVVRSDFGIAATSILRFAIVFALLAMILAFLVLQVRIGSVLLNSGVIGKSVIELLALPDDDKLLPFIDRHYQDLIGGWLNVLSNFRITLEWKARCLWLAQICMLLAAGCVFGFLWLALAARQGFPATG